MAKNQKLGTSSNEIILSIIKEISRKNNLNFEDMLNKTYWGNTYDLIIYNISNKPIDVSDIGLIHRIEQAKNYFKIWLQRDKFLYYIKEKNQETPFIIKSNIKDLRNKKIIVEHTSINPVHQLHIGGMRGSIIGNCLKKLLQSYGALVDTHFYVNDLGNQVKTLNYIVSKLPTINIEEAQGLGKKIGLIYAMGSMLLKGYYHEFNRLEKQAPQVAKLFEGVNLNSYELKNNSIFNKSLVDKMLKEIKKDLATINIKIDVDDYESDYSNDLEKLLYVINNKYPISFINGTMCIKFNQAFIPLARNDDTSLYFLRDIAYAKHRSHRCDLSINVVGYDQKVLQEALVNILKTIEGKELLYRGFGLVKSNEMRFSARRGRLLTVEDIISKYGKEGLINVIFNMSKVKCTKNITLKDEHFNSSPFGFIIKQLEYAEYKTKHCKDLMKKNENSDINDEVWNLIKLLLQYEEFTDRCIKRLEIHNLNDYATKLASAYKKAKIHIPKEFVYSLNFYFQKIVIHCLKILGLYKESLIIDYKNSSNLIHI